MKGSVKLPVFIDEARKLVNTTQLRAKYLGATYEAEYCQWQTLHGLGSLMETASLIITPNAYLEGQLLSTWPPDGSGDLSVTRATTATRVNSAGLVELVPYNLFGYSEDFSNAYWTQLNVTINANTTTAPNGTLTADTAQFASGSYIGRTFTHSGVHTFSVYAKYIGTQWLCIENFNGTDLATWFNIQSGTIGTIESGVTANIESVGNGWYRCSITMNATSASSSIYAIFNTTANGGFTRTGSSYLWGAQLVEGSVAKDYQKTETRLNIPRLDYSNGTCPSILVEPQRTNSCINSNTFNGAGWFANGIASYTKVSNPITGMNDATKVVKTTGNTDPFFSQGVGAFNGTWTYSIWLWTDSGQPTTAALYMFNSTVTEFFALPITLTNTPTRYEFTNTFSNMGGLLFIRTVLSGADANQYIYAYGAQVESNAFYATSYIPTTSASVTRNADVISKTGISSLIGQTEGTLFLDFYYDGSVNNHMIIRDPSYSTYIYFNSQNANQLWGQIQNVGIQFSMSATAGRYKMALAYKSGNSALYVNGAQIGTSATTFSVVGTMSELDYTLSTPNNKINASALWKTRLTNTQLAQLTTI